MFPNELFVIIFFGINAIIRAGIVLLIDFISFVRGDKKNINEKHKSYKNNWIAFLLAFTTTYYLWGLLILIPILPNILLQFINKGVLYGMDGLFVKIVQIIGVALISLGTIIASLGRISRGTKSIAWGLPPAIVTHGIYGYIRHPLYVSYFCYYVGFTLYFQSLIIVPLLLGILGYIRITNFEEKILLRNFGEEYKDYMEKVGGFFPHLLKKNQEKHD